MAKTENELSSTQHPQNQGLASRSVQNVFEAGQIPAEETLQVVRAGLRRSAGRRRREAAGDAIHADASPWHGATCCTLPARAIDWFPVRAKGSSPRRQTTLLPPPPPRPTDSFSSPLVRSRQGQDCATASYPAPTTHREPSQIRFCRHTEISAAIGAGLCYNLPPSTVAANQRKVPRPTLPIQPPLRIRTTSLHRVAGVVGAEISTHLPWISALTFQLSNSSLLLWASKNCINTSVRVASALSKWISS